MHFANVSYHNSISQPCCFEFHCIGRPEPLQHAAVCDVEYHSHRRHPDALVRTFHLFTQDGDRTRTDINGLNLASGMNMPRFRNEVTMLTVQSFQPFARTCKFLAFRRNCSNTKENPSCRGGNH